MEEKLDDLVTHGLRDLGKTLRDSRIARRHSQAAAADRIGISRATVQRMEAGGVVAAGVAIEAWLRALRYCGLNDYILERLTRPEFATERALAVRESDFRNGGSMSPAKADSD